MSAAVAQCQLSVSLTSALHTQGAGMTFPSVCVHLCTRYRAGYISRRLFPIHHGINVFQLVKHFTEWLNGALNGKTADTHLSKVKFLLLRFNLGVNSIKIGLHGKLIFCKRTGFPKDLFS